MLLPGGSPIKTGIRYILAGFLELGVENNNNNNNNAFLRNYDPLFDGFAAQSGFLTGDQIVGLQVCELQDEDITTKTTVTVTGDQTAATTTTSTKVLKRMVEVLPSWSDEDWVEAAQVTTTIIITI